MNFVQANVNYSHFVNGCYLVFTTYTLLAAASSFDYDYDYD